MIFGLIDFILFQSLPPMFSQKYGNNISANVTLVLRNGEELNIEFRKELGVFVGMKQLFQRFDCSTGCVLAFQYNGCDNFWVHVITSGFEVYGGNQFFIWKFHIEIVVDV